MKKYSLFFIIIPFTLIIFGCEGFLDSEDLVNKNTTNFPKTEVDIEQSLTGVYAALTLSQNRWDLIFQFSEFMADYTLPGGGADDRHIRALAQFQQYGVNVLSDMWGRLYTGIYRANFLLENIDKVKFADESTKSKALGETYFLRSNFYFDLLRVFENVPLILTSKVDPTTPQSDPNFVYQSVFSDLVKAIDLLPAVKFVDAPKSELGRVTRWAAEGMLARAYLFYSGVYGKSEIELLDGSVLDKQRVIAYLDDCIANSSHDLINDFRNLWPYSYISDDYTYAKKNNLKWIGEAGDNVETVWAWKYSIFGTGSRKNYSNGMVTQYGIRFQEFVPFGRGNGMGIVNPKFFEMWPDDDIRKKGTILDVSDPDECTDYKYNKGRNYQETGLFNKKYMPINEWGKNGKPVSYTVRLYGAPNNYVVNNTQDAVIIRFADILLMGAELGGPNAQSYLDRVRNRVGLGSVEATLENIKKERLYELAYEGVRYYDLMRWGDLEHQINTMKKDVPCKIYGKDALYTIKYRPETRGFFAIPEDQIELSNGVLKQNKGWGTVESQYKE